MKRITFSPPRRRSRDDRWTMQLDGQTVAIISSRCALEALENALNEQDCWFKRSELPSEKVIHDIV